MASYTMSKKDEDALAAAGAAWNKANAAGDEAGKKAAHAQAEAIRANYGYSGGSDGSQHIAISNSGSGNKTSNYTPVGAGSDHYSQYVGMSAADQATLKSYGDQYNAAIAAGDRDAANAAHQAAEALRGNYGYSGGTDGSEYIQLQQPQPPVVSGGGFSFDPAPTYTDNYSARIDAMLNEILNRDAFSYNAAEDDLYKQYAQQYQREGQRAMQDTIGQAAARTGGMASSYATSAAAQANNYYASQLADKIPELYQLAYQMYLDDIDLKVQDLGLLNNASNTQYDRYRDTMSDWRDDRNFAYNMYRDDIGDQQWQTTFDYNAGRDSVADMQWGMNFGYNAFRDNVADQRYDQQWEYNVGRDQVEDERYEQEWAYQLAQDALKNEGTDSSGGGGSDYSGGDQTSDKTGGGGYDNGSLDKEYIKKIQAELGVTEDGFYGPATREAAGDVSAEQAYKNLFGSLPTGSKYDTTTSQGLSFKLPDAVEDELARLELSSHPETRVMGALQTFVNSGKITEEQAIEIARNRYGIQLEYEE